MNNSVFGKTLENSRNRVNVELVHKERRMKKLIASPAFHAFKIFNPDLVGVYDKKILLKLNRPIFTGACILDFSKHLMYDFHYNYIKEKYQDNATLLFADTDSLCYEIICTDVYQDMKDNLHLFDTSDYITTHIAFSEENKKVVGKM